MNNIRKLSMRNVINDRNVKNTKFTNSLVKWEKRDNKTNIFVIDCHKQSLKPHLHWTPHPSPSLTTLYLKIHYNHIGSPLIKQSI
jgi:hypothetical protein